MDYEKVLRAGDEVWVEVQLSSDGPRKHTVRGWATPIGTSDGWLGVNLSAPYMNSSNQFVHYVRAKHHTEAAGYENAWWMWDEVNRPPVVS